MRVSLRVPLPKVRPKERFSFKSVARVGVDRAG